MFSKIASTLGAAAVVAAAMLGFTAQAQAAPGCSSVTQIGSTGYITNSAGTQIASVKQYKGCNKNYAYTYVWESFRSSHSQWYFCASVAKEDGGRPTLMDTRCELNKAEVWSSGASTLSSCTHAAGLIQWGSNERQGKSSTRC